MPSANLDQTLQSLEEPDLCRRLLDALTGRMTRGNGGRLKFMEVCGTHTVAIFRSGLRSLLPEGVTHLSGPGCPVCVTHEREIAAALALAEKNEVILATFGDLMRVPGPGGRSLKSAAAEGARIRVVYSPTDALSLAREARSRQSGDKVIFLGVGFETTAPAVAATIQMARAEGLDNFQVFSCHKLVPPALAALLEEEDCAVDAFLLPGHVSTILGVEPYRFVADKFGKPGVIGGFAPADILQALLIMLDELEKCERGERPGIINQYSRAVADGGNPKARRILFEVFTPADALWRGLGPLPASGLTIRPEYAAFDAAGNLPDGLPEAPEIKGCKCGLVLKGKIAPPDCLLFGKACTPEKPIGPCMVSTEGSCAAYFKYSLE